MSRRSIKEYILRQQEDYLGELDRRRRSRMLDEVCRMTGLGRKYVIRLLRGTRTYRERPGRSKSYGPAEETPLVQAWEGSGCLCAKYLKADIGRWLRDLGQLQYVHPAVAANVAAMSASTMERILKGRPRTAKAWGRRNRRSGHNGLMALVPCESGEDVPVWESEPGDVQVDSGPELVNSVIHEYLTGHWPRTRFSRSWPGRKNHNAHIEQKNGSVLRAFIGDTRLGQPGLRWAFELLLEAI